MINLIPNEEKKRMSKNFYIRLTALCFSMLGISVLIASVLIFPSFFLSLVEERSVKSQLEAQENESIPLPDQNTLAVVDDLNRKLDLVENIQKKERLFSQNILDEIILGKIHGIKITEISYKKVPEKGEIINVSGLAESRETLVSFRQALENNPAFSKVDLPISNFVRGSDIRFYLSLIPS